MAGVAQSVSALYEPDGRQPASLNPGPAALDATGLTNLRSGFHVTPAVDRLSVRLGSWSGTSGVSWWRRAAPHDVSNLRVFSSVGSAA